MSFSYKIIIIGLLTGSALASENHSADYHNEDMNSEAYEKEITSCEYKSSINKASVVCFVGASELEVFLQRRVFLSFEEQFDAISFSNNSSEVYLGLLKASGYLDATKVVTSGTPQEIFRPGTRYRVGDISITTNSQDTDPAFIQVGSGDFFSDDILEKITYLTLEDYIYRGFLDSEIIEEEIKKTNGEANIHLRLDLGMQKKLSDVFFRNENIFSEDYMKTLSPIKTGDIISPENLQTLTSTLEQYEFISLEGYETVLNRESQNYDLIIDASQIQSRALYGSLDYNALQNLETGIGFHAENVMKRAISLDLSLKKGFLGDEIRAVAIAPNIIMSGDNVTMVYSENRGKSNTHWYPSNLARVDWDKEFIGNAPEDRTTRIHLGLVQQNTFGQKNMQHSRNTELLERRDFGKLIAGFSQTQSSDSFSGKGQKRPEWTMELTHASALTSNTSDFYSVAIESVLTAPKQIPFLSSLNVSYTNFNAHDAKKVPRHVIAREVTEGSSSYITAQFVDVDDVFNEMLPNNISMTRFGITSDSFDIKRFGIKATLDLEHTRFRTKRDQWGHDFNIASLKLSKPFGQRVLEFSLSKRLTGEYFQVPFIEISIK